MKYNTTLSIILLAVWSISTLCFNVFMILEYFIGIDNFWTIFLYHYGTKNNLHIIHLHIAGNLILCIFGPLQLANLKYKRRLQQYHPFIGAIYIVGIFCVSCSWILFVVFNRSKGEYYISVPCGIYPTLVIIYSMITICCAIKQYPSHKYWAIRLYMLSMSPVIYRIFYLFIGLPIPNIFYWLFFIIPILYSEIYLIITYRTKHLRCKNEDDINIYINVPSGELIYPN